MTCERPRGLRPGVPSWRPSAGAALMGHGEIPARMAAALRAGQGPFGAQPQQVFAGLVGAAQEEEQRVPGFALRILEAPGAPGDPILLCAGLASPARAGQLR